MPSMHLAPFSNDCVIPYIQVAALCTSLRPEAAALVDAWDFDDIVLNSTIGGELISPVFREARSCMVTKRTAV